MHHRTAILLLACAIFCTATVSAADAAPRKQKIVLIAGVKSHGPEGNGMHDYPWSVRLIKAMLDRSNVADKVAVEYHLNGWPKDQGTLDDADTIVIISDGRDGDKYSEAPHLISDQRVEYIGKQMKRGCGLVTFHFSTFAPNKYAEQVLNWNGAFFQWETEGKRQWYSAITNLNNTPVSLESPKHAVSNGVKPFTLTEEFYYNLRFKDGDTALTPLCSVAALQGRDAAGKVVAWARERPDGGRGFGTTMGHFYANWKNDDFRRLILNGIAWSAHVDIPATGIESSFIETPALKTLLPEFSAAKENADPIRVLILTGNDGPFHDWRSTHLVIKEALERDARMNVTVSTDIEVLAREDLKAKYDVLVQNYVNWQTHGLSDKAKENLSGFVKGGGGFVVMHFADGAFHFSLPGAAESDWPEYRKLVRRVWNHQGQGEQKSSHDSYGPFSVHVTDAKHPVTEGLKDFQTTDELYFNQNGDEPITPLLTAKSKSSGKDEPLAWAYTYGEGRVFQTLLGHDVKALRTPEVMEIIRRAGAWTAKKEIGIAR